MHVRYFSGIFRTELLLSKTGRPVIHVTESFGGGVATAIKDYCRNYPEVEHHLIYSERDDSPISSSDLEGFVSVKKLPSSHLGRLRALRQTLSSHTDAVVHAHSSFAGAYVRGAIKKSQRRPIVYTPHCYGFERRDVGVARRSIFWLIEWALAFNTNVFAGCSTREVGLSAWPLVNARRVLIPNVPAADLQQYPGVKAKKEKLAVVGVGRLSPQKDPDFFRTSVLGLREAGLDFDAKWIGGGDPSIAQKLRDAGIEVTGWLPRPQALNALKKADLYLHTALWEGFPLAVLESSTLGVPTLVRDIAAFDDLPDELKIRNGLPEFLSVSLTDAEGGNTWRFQNLNCWKLELSDNRDQTQAEGLRSAYTL